MIREPWPLDGVEFEKLKEQHAEREIEDLEINDGIYASQHRVSLVTSTKSHF